MAAPSGSDDRVFDLREFTERLDGDVEAVAELIDIFLEDVPALEAVIREGRDDLDRLRRTAHTLKGATGNMGAAGAMGAAADLEQAARGNDAGAVEERRLRLLDELAALVAALRRVRARLAAGEEP